MPHTNIPYSEWTALQSFYHSTNGQYWRYKRVLFNTTHWNFTHYPTNNPCYDQWAGIICTCHHYEHNHYNTGYSYYYYQTNPNLVSNCTVLKLILVNYNLSGTLTSQIGNLRNLTILRLYHNNIGGSLPTELGQLVNIKRIGFGKNKLIGTIPSSLGKLKQLQVLILHSNFLTGSIPSSLGNLDKLLGLELNTNSLTGNIPSSLGKLNHLELLGIEINFLSGTIPSSLGNLNQLFGLDLDSNSLTGTLPSALGNLNQLRGLVLFSNFLTGSIPSSFGEISKLIFLGLNSNSFTGTIPSSLGNINQLQFLYLSSNSFSGTIPFSLGKLNQLQILDLCLNSLIGTIPSLLKNLKSLSDLFLYSNKLSGSITNIFNSTLQTHLQTIQLSNNQLTGSLSEEIFKLPNLYTLDIASNCFSEDIPYPTICQSKTLINLILDGLHTATSCRQQVSPLFSSAYTFSSNIFNKLNPCVFTMTSLITLHLSGNGLTGSLPNYYNISQSLTDLSLSHNLLTGTLPNSFQWKKWDNLDLSFNRIGGTLSSGFANQNSGSSLVLQQNSLSGNFPESLLDILNINVLSGNIFNCDLTKSNLPKYDSDISNYSCGSNIFDISYYIWLGVTFFSILAFVIWRIQREYKFEGRSKWKLSTCISIIIFGNVMEIFPEKSSSINKNLFVGIMEKVIHLLIVLFYLMAYIVIILLTIYTVNGFYFGIYTYQYAWTVSVAFQFGNVAFGITFSALFILLCLLLFLTINSNLSTNYKEKNSQNVSINKFFNHNKSNSQSTKNSSDRIIFSITDFKLSYFPSLPSLTWTFTPIINVVVVGGVNILYVILYLSASSSVIVFLQILLAMFKSFWNGIGYRYLNRVINSHYNVDNLSLKHSSLQLFIRLLNNIAIPCVVVALINPDCFYNVIVAAPKVKSTYQYNVCTLFKMDGSCIGHSKPSQTTTFDPPFVYSYQCSSRFITYYASAFVFLCIIDGFFVPFAEIVGAQLYSYGVEYNAKWIILMRKAMPPILKTDRINNNKKSKRDKYHPYFDSLQLFLNNFTYLGLIMTFGAVFPPLAASFFVTVCLMNCWFFWKANRFVEYAKEKNRLEFVDIIEEECKDCLSSEVVVRSVWMIITISCLFYSLFLFDTLGDAAGVAGSYWVLVVTPLVPLVDYLMYRVIVWVWCINGDDNGNYIRESELEIVIVENRMSLNLPIGESKI